MLKYYLQSSRSRTSNQFFDVQILTQTWIFFHSLIEQMTEEDYNKHKTDLLFGTNILFLVQFALCVYEISTKRYF